ncbi:glycerophosphoryl diester phosphodiesterase [Fusarium albosuccineum]|uniref:glycerophosphodiester phosphodiesterase n=1 Tax=Fusarium albosuccineum TaxID=1237068 RepID=A0A8H4LI55_9HYPO|nr:glycerophosphoryl diester phosphodiesterase [Fusarium albosuccineum]
MRFSTSLLAGLAVVSPVAAIPRPPYGGNGNFKPVKQVELGPRPYFLVNDMDEGPLKKKLESCSEKPQKPSEWSIGHRGGGTLMIPEHSLQSNLAGARQGAGVLECDVAFTKDRELVCRHSQCDLHYTTNILTIPELNKKCTQPFQPAKNGKPASAKCCTSDITLKEFKSLCAKMEGFNATATNVTEYQHGTPSWRTELYDTCGTILSLKEHIAMVEDLGLKHTPELKTPEVKMPFQGDYTQKKYAQQLIDTYKKAGVSPKKVYLQSFLYDDILYWLKADPQFAAQAMYLDETGDTPETFETAVANLTRYVEDGLKFIAPPLPYLVKAKDGKIVPSEYAIKAKKLGLKIITWSLERSGPLENGANGDYYYYSIASVVNNDGDVYKLLDVFRQIGVFGVFSDWSSTVTYYANCFGIKLRG